MMPLLRRALTPLVLAVIWSGLVSGASAERVPLDRIVAVVNGEVIPWSRLWASIPQKELEAARALPPIASASEIHRLESKVLEDLVETRLQVQEAAAEGITVSDQEVENAIKSIKEKYRLSDEQLARELEAEGVTLDLYRENLRDQITVSRVVNRVVRSRTVVTDETIDAQLKKEFPESSNEVIGARIRLIALDLRYPAAAETKDRIEEIRRQYEKGTPFENLARDYSVDPSARNGGDLGMIRRGDLMPELEKAAFSLKKGQISEPIHIGDKVYLVLVDDIRDRADDMAAKRQEIKSRLQEEAFQKEYQAWLRKLKAKAYIEIKLN